MVEFAGRVLLPFRTLHGLRIPLESVDEGVYVARSADEWVELSRRLFQSQYSSLPVPSLDWQTEMWVFVSVGTRSSGGYTVLFDTISVLEGRIIVLAWEIRPGPNCGTTRDITHPCAAVAAEAHPGELVLVKRIADEDCEAIEW